MLDILFTVTYILCNLVSLICLGLGVTLLVYLIKGKILDNKIKQNYLSQRNDN